MSSLSHWCEILLLIFCRWYFVAIYIFYIIYIFILLTFCLIICFRALIRTRREWLGWMSSSRFVYLYSQLGMHTLVTVMNLSSLIIFLALVKLFFLEQKKVCPAYLVYQIMNQFWNINDSMTYLIWNIYIYYCFGACKVPICSLPVFA